MTLCFDLDGTICHTKKDDELYIDVLPINGMPELMRELKSSGHYIIISTARHMKTCDGNVGKIVARQGEALFAWLKKHNIPYDEIYFGKPLADFYIDDKGLKFTGAADLRKSLCTK